MKVKGETITIKELFTLDTDNHKSIAGGVFGITHGLIVFGAMFLAAMISGPSGIVRSMFFTGGVGALIVAFYYRKETHLLTRSLFDERSTPFKTLDSRLDFLVPLVVWILFLIGKIVFWYANRTPV